MDEKNITFSKGDNKNNQHLVQASSKESYSVPSYSSFVPTQVRDAADKYITKYYNKFKRANTKLTKGMITIAFSTFKHGLHLTEQEEIDEHFSDVHGISDGPTVIPPPGGGEGNRIIL